MMSSFIVLMLVTWIMVVLAASILRGSGKWTTAFQTLAEHYGGWFSAAGFLRRPAAAFTYNNSPCHLRCKSRRKFSPGPQTELRIAWPLKNTRLEVIRNHGSSRIRALRTLPPVSLGDTAFEERFTIRCDDSQTATKLLSSGVKWEIQQLASLPGSDSAYIGFDRGWLTISKRGYVKQPQLLDDFVRLALGVFDQALLTLSEGLEFCETRASVLGQVKCPVCSSDVTGAMVVCVRCKTPHCLDCWHYNGRCGMFACGETRYAEVTSSQETKKL